MKPSIISALVLLSSLLTYSTASYESQLEALLDSIADGTTVLTHPVIVLVFTLICLLCPAVKVTGLTLADLTGLLSATEPDLNDLTLLYLTSNASFSYNMSTAASEIVTNPYFNASQKLYVYIHGFISQANSTDYQQLRANLLANSEHNVLALDASALLNWWYIRASSYTLFIGGKLAQVLISMVSMGLDPAKVHVIGHSLGAHISGFTGKNFTSLSGNKLGRISGLDPAGPCFAYLKAKYHLNSTDATYVDVIHSNAGVFGISDSVGVADYWPNGGTTQAGCESEICNHGRSVLYYIESINNTAAFPAKTCSSYATYALSSCSANATSYMGYPSTSSSGDYYLTTSSSSPFGLGTS